MALKAKHIVEEVNGIRCTIIEKNASTERTEFLKNLLEFNNFKVQVAEEVSQVESIKTYTVGVTDLVFNPVIAVYEMSLKTPDGQKVSPAYWDQRTKNSNNEYWEL